MPCPQGGRPVLPGSWEHPDGAIVASSEAAKHSQPETLPHTRGWSSCKAHRHADFHPIKFSLPASAGSSLGACEWVLRINISPWSLEKREGPSCGHGVISQAQWNSRLSFGLLLWSTSRSSSGGKLQPPERKVSFPRSGGHHERGEWTGALELEELKSNS